MSLNKLFVFLVYIYKQFTILHMIKRLDASKAFDRVQYCKLFNELVNHSISPLVLRLLSNMYTKQKLQVRWEMPCHSSLQYVMG